MAKKKKPTPKAAEQTAPKASPKPSIPFVEPTWMKQAFMGLAVLIFIIMQVMSMGSGVNGDERFHIPQGESSLKYYKSFGKNQDFMKPRCNKKLEAEIGAENCGDMVGETTYRYGGLIDIPAAVVNNVLGNEPDEPGYRKVRYSMMAAAGFVGVLFAGLLVWYFTGSWLYGMIGMLFLFLAPHYTGHALMNPKDLPFAAFYIASIFFVIKFVKELPTPKWSTLIGLVVMIALGINVRVGNVLVLIYLGMFFVAAVAIDYFMKGQTFKAVNYRKAVIQMVVVMLLAYFLGLVFWPYGLMNPIANPKEALSGFSEFHTNLTVFFDGVQMQANEIPNNYTLKWIIATTPLIILIGVIPGLVWLVMQWKDKKKFLLGFIVFFAFAFPLFYVGYRDSLLYCAWRHMLFAYPPIAVLSVLGWYWLGGKLKNSKMHYLVAGVLVVALAMPAAFIFKYQDLSYTYFNITEGGTDDAFTNWETDYWMLGVKDAADWIKEQPDVQGNDSILIATDCFYPAKFYFAQNGNVSVRYVTTTNFGNPSRSMNGLPWDYGIFFSRDYSKEMLENGAWPPGNTVHTVDVGGAPLIAVVKRPTDDIYEGYKLLGQARDEQPGQVTNQQAQQALQYMEQGLQSEPYNIQLLYDLYNFYSQLGNQQKAQEFANRLYGISPSLFNQ